LTVDRLAAASLRVGFDLRRETSAGDVALASNEVMSYHPDPAVAA